MQFFPHPKDANLRVLRVAKNNLSREKLCLEYRMESCANDQPRLVSVGPCKLSDTEIFGRKGKRKDSTLPIATEVLYDELREGPGKPLR